MNEKRKRIIFYVLGSIFLAFLVLTILVSSFPVFTIDREFSEEIQEHQHPILDLLMKAISWPGTAPQSAVLVLCTSLIFFLFKRKREALFIALTLLSGVISRLLKILIDRPRPTEDLVQILEAAKHQSFPSGHVLFYVVFLGFLIVVMKQLKEINQKVRIVVIALCAFLIFTVPVSRIYLGAHWFTDVLGSAMLGIIGLFALSYFYLKKPSISS
jgi:undecaprenyl-diphosphatase